MTHTSTVCQVLQIKKTLCLQSIVVVFDQALSPKLPGWKHSAQFNDTVLRMGVSHTIFTFLAVMGKCFQDAALQDVCMESGMIANGYAIIVPSGFPSTSLKLLTD